MLPCLYESQNRENENNNNIQSVKSVLVTWIYVDCICTRSINVKIHMCIMFQHRRHNRICIAVAAKRTIMQMHLDFRSIVLLVGLVIFGFDSILEREGEKI